MNNPKLENITGLILAGGKARRMGGEDKGLLDINGQSMISYVIQSLEKQVSNIIINANRNLGRYKKFGYPVISDHLQNFQGPLAGLCASFYVSKTDYICTCPCDGPLIPDDLVSRLYNKMTEGEAEIAVAHDGVRLQPVYALLKCNLQSSLEQYLSSGERKIDRWFEQHKMTAVDFSDNLESFKNINTPEDQEKISIILAKH